MRRAHDHAMQASAARFAAGALAITAGLIHLGVAPEHFDEWFPFGVFMTVVGAAQLVAGALLLVRPTRWLVVATMVGTVLVFVVFAVAYTAGLPVGPMPWKREELGPVVLVSKGVELVLLLALAAMARSRSEMPNLPRGTRNSATHGREIPR